MEQVMHKQAYLSFIVKSILTSIITLDVSKSTSRLNVELPQFCFFFVHFMKLLRSVLLVSAKHNKLNVGLNKCNKNIIIIRLQRYWWCLPSWWRSDDRWMKHQYFIHQSESAGVSSTGHLSSITLKPVLWGMPWIRSEFLFSATLIARQICNPAKWTQHTEYFWRRFTITLFFATVRWKKI